MPSRCLEDENTRWRGKSRNTGPEAGAIRVCSSSQKAPGAGKHVRSPEIREENKLKGSLFA